MNSKGGRKRRPSTPRPRSSASSATASMSRSWNRRSEASSRKARSASAFTRATSLLLPPIASPTGNPLPEDEFETKIVEFTKGMIEGMGYGCEAVVLFREEKKLGIRIDSEHASIIIGKKGKNLDALQVLVNVYAGRLGREDTRVILDSENYRIRREEALVRLAYETGEQVRSTRQSILLEPMNPFERRIIHTTLNDIVDIETKSEGEGLYKQVRVTFRGRV